MGDFDPKDIYKGESSDFDPKDIYVEGVKSEDTKSSDKYNLPETALIQGAQGATAGFYDELAGALSAAGRPFGVTGLGGPMKDIGLTSPTLSSEDILNEYKRVRDIERQKVEQTEKESPAISFASQLAGGLLTAPLLPGGTLAKGATLGQKVLAGAKAGAAGGALIGAGQSKEDLTSGELAPITGLGEDIFRGAALGTAIGGAVPPTIEAAKGTAGLIGKLIPEPAKQAFKKGLEGIDVASDEFYKGTGKKLEDIVKKVSDPILKRVEAQRAEHSKIINNVDEQINKITNRIEQSKELDKLSQIAQNKQDINLVENKIHETAKNLQEDVFNVQNGLRKTFDKLDDAAEATGILPDFKPAISQFEQKIEGQVSPELFTKVMKPLKSLYESERNINNYRGLKDKFADLFNDPNPVIRGQAKQAYSVLKNTYLNDLRAAGKSELADQINQTNSRWRNIINLEEEFIPQISPEKIGEKLKFYPEAKTITALESLSPQNAKKMAQGEKFSDLLEALSPELKQKYQSQMGELMPQKEAVSAFKPQESKIIDPEALRLENMLKQLKGETPEKIPGLELSTKTKEGLTKELEGLLPKFEMRTAEQEAERKLDQTFNFLKSEIGEQASGEIKKELAPLAKDLELRKIVSSGSKEKLPTSIEGMIESITGGLVKGAGKAGLGVKKVQDVLSLGTKKLSTSSPQELQAFGQKMIQTDPSAEPYVKVLNQAAEKNEISRNAIIFGLMQQPKFRDLYKKTEGIKDETTGE